MKILIPLSILVVVLGFVYCFSCTNTMRDSVPMEAADQAEEQDEMAGEDDADAEGAPHTLLDPAALTQHAIDESLP